MEHTEASETMAAERYLLGEMTPEDRDAFEEHFFGCAECAADVRHGAQIGAAIRTQKANRTRQPRTSAARQWVAAAAVAAAVSIVPIMQNVGLRQQISMARSPHVATAYFLTGASRGSEDAIDGRQPFTLGVDFPQQQNAQRYIVEVVDAAGHVRVTEKVTAEAARDTQHPPNLQIPGGWLPPGRYSLKVHAEPAGSPETWSFVVR